MKTDAMVLNCYAAKYREEAVNKISPYLDLARPMWANEALASKLYDFSISLLSVDVDDVSDVVDLTENVISEFDHALSSSPGLSGYTAECTVTENGQDPKIGIALKFDGEDLCNLQMTPSAARLMAHKRCLELSV